MFRPIPTVSLATKRIVGVILTCALISAIVWVIERERLTLSDIRLAPLIILASLASPVGLIFNAWTLTTIAQREGLVMPKLFAIKVTIASTAANFLPIPGGLLTRIGALVYCGMNKTSAVSAITLVSILRLIASAFCTGIGLMSFAYFYLGIGLALTSLLALLILIQLNNSRRTRLTQLLVCQQFSLAGIEAVRMIAALWSVGAASQYAAGFVMSGSGVAGAIIGVAPAGIGIREAAATGLGFLADIEPGVALIAATMSRVVGLVAIMITSIFFLIAGTVPRPEHTQSTTGSPHRPHESSRP